MAKNDDTIVAEVAWIKVRRDAVSQMVHLVDNGLYMCTLVPQDWELVKRNDPTKSQEPLEVSKLLKLKEAGFETDDIVKLFKEGVLA